MRTPIYQPETNTYLIPLTKGYHAVVDPIDVDLADVLWKAAEDHGNVYARRNVQSNGKRITTNLHRVIMGRILGRALSTQEKVDHQNNIGTDCRRENLRLATNSQNLQNSRVRRDSQSGLKGASFRRDRNKWEAKIQIGKKRIMIGRYDTPEEAHAAYVERATLEFGEFANPGLPPRAFTNTEPSKATYSRPGAVTTRSHRHHRESEE